MLKNSTQPILLQKLFELLEVHRGHLGKRERIGEQLLYFMHLKFDSRLFALPFAPGIVLAVPMH